MLTKATKHPSLRTKLHQAEVALAEAWARDAALAEAWAEFNSFPEDVRLSPEGVSLYLKLKKKESGDLRQSDEMDD